MRAASTVNNISVQVLATGLGLTGSVLQARWLGPDNRGLLALVMLYPSLAYLVLNFGIFASTTYLSSKEDTNIGKLWSALLVLCGIQTIIAFSIGRLLIAWLLNRYETDTILLSQHFLITVPLALLAAYAQSILRGRKHFAINNALKLIIPIGYCLITSVLYINNTMSVKLLVYSQIVLQFCTCVASMVVLLRYEVIQLSGRVFIEIKELLSYGARLWLSEMTEVVNGRLDQIMIGSYLNTATLGIYNIAVSYANLSTILANGVRQIMLPYVSATQEQTDKHTEVYLFFNRFWPLSLLQLVCMLVGAAYLVPVLFGEAYREAILPAQMLSIVFLFLNAKNVLSTALQGLGKPGETATVDTVGLGLTLLLMTYLNSALTLWTIVLILGVVYLVQFIVTLYYISINGLITRRLLFQFKLSLFIHANFKWLRQS
ncbi:oligosaccharide flippase family protein [Fibrella aquatilis]|uniref:Oligosaccharide flippase family protein n=1 Tax=Fibrella aquatilis TaxID=2817059 RepID=A0A939GBW9_9BACT|nr:oligosaccharide flippase family protein [Fibrella aquatilis]MBO0933558.1 oligosaccharide flippase family protein [Fibrella aquatilis]